MTKHYKNSQGLKSKKANLRFFSQQQHNVKMNTVKKFNTTINMVAKQQQDDKGQWSGMLEDTKRELLNCMQNGSEGIANSVLEEKNTTAVGVESHCSVTTPGFPMSFDDQNGTKFSYEIYAQSNIHNMSNDICSDYQKDFLQLWQKCINLELNVPSYYESTIGINTFLPLTVMVIAAAIILKNCFCNKPSENNNDDNDREQLTFSP